jgi:hypothetical protein
MNKPRILWIDAICINQDDNDERGEQVARMGAIYGQATTVVLWLGEVWPDMGLAWRFFMVLGMNAALHVKPAMNPSCGATGVDVESSRFMRALNQFAAFDWRSRVWTMQEQVLARSSIFQRDKKIIDGELVLNAARTFNDHGSCCLHTASESVLNALVSINKLLDAPQSVELSDAIWRNTSILDHSYSTRCTSFAAGKQQTFETRSTACWH